MCLEAAKSIPTGELLAYKLIARRKEDGVFVSPIQKSHVWNTNRVVVLDDSPEIWESSTDAKIGKGFIHTFSEEKPPMYQIIQTIKKFVGGWYYYFDQVYDTYDLGIIQCKLGGTMYKGLDELGHPGFASTDVELIPESYECLFKSYEDVQNVVENIYKKCRY